MIISDFFSMHNDGREMYKPVYEEFLTDVFCIATKNILEIGIQYGIGLAAWLKSFPLSQVYGIDQSPVSNWKYDIKDHPRLFTHVGNSAIKDHVDEFFQKINNVKMDIIIDDADHQETSQLPTLQLFLPHLSDHGVYIIEDTGPRAQGCEFVKKVQDVCKDRKAYARPVSNLKGVIVISR